MGQLIYKGKKGCSTIEFRPSNSYLTITNSFDEITRELEELKRKCKIIEGIMPPTVKIRTNCPNCGAPLPIPSPGMGICSCEYCDSIVSYIK